MLDAAACAAASTKSFRVSRSTTSFAPIGSGASSGIGAGAGAGAGIGVVGLASSSQAVATRDISASANAAPANRVTGREGIRLRMAPMVAVAHSAPPRGGAESHWYDAEPTTWVKAVSCEGVPGAV